MGLRKIFILFILSFLICDYTFAQQTQSKTDSTHLYENIESFSKKSNFKSFVYRLIFKPVDTISKKKESKIPVIKSYRSFEGKIIRKISVITVDPFGYSIIDTAKYQHNFLNKAGNSLHVKTREVTIKNLLLIHENEPFNSLLTDESERLIRTQKYVTDVRFYIMIAAPGSDSLDILIREFDKWSLIPDFSISASQTTIGLTDKNILGTGA